MDRRVIDLHCDTLSECLARKLTLADATLQFSLDRLPAGYRICQAMAAFVPDELRGQDAVEYSKRLCGLFWEQVELFSDRISPVIGACGIGAALERRRCAAMLTIEGGAALGGRLENIRRFHDMGVRMMTLTWNGENELCGGCATDIGFTEFGRAAVAEMERAGMAVDVSHLSDRAFWELCDIAEKPFAASHSNSRTVCGHRRNLSDAMFSEIARRGGVVGLNYSKGFIREDGESGSVGDLLRHVHHFLELGGENTLALGSDFDGTDTPDYLDGVNRTGYLADCLENSGIPAAATDKILYNNAERFFSGFAAAETPTGATEEERT